MSRFKTHRFIATGAAVATVKDAHKVLKSIRSEMPDANHHVYAFKVGFGASVSEGVSDDGEPSGTAGPPTLAVVRGSGIGDLIVVTTRYFGGTKLGTGGLVAAYTGAAQAVIAALETETKVNRQAYQLAIPYNLLSQVQLILQECDCLVAQPVYESLVHLQYRIPEENVIAMTSKMRDLTAGRFQPLMVDEGAE